MWGGLGSLGGGAVRMRRCSPWFLLLLEFSCAALLWGR